MPPTSDSTFPVPGLEQEVEILVDEWGIPHIYAGSQRDVFLAQGFNAARDRLFQMDLARRRGLGLLSEVFGPEHLEQDRAARLFLYRGDMRAEWLAYGSDTKAVTTAFVAGINAYVAWALEDAGTRLPPEFALFGYEPSTWEPRDIAVMRSHGLFGNAEHELTRALTVRDFGEEVEDLRRTRQPAVGVSIPEGLDLEKLSQEVLSVYRLALAPVCPPDDPSVLELPHEGDGSNNWVLSADRTSTGRPILANDPHRAIGMPGLRYIAHLSAPGLDVIGGGEPALPGVSIGHNGKVAFGLTIFSIDQEDLYLYETNPDDPSSYRYEGRWEQMRTVTETIPVAGSGPEEVELRFTRHGPVLYEDPARNVAVAIRLAWLEPGMAPYLGSMDYMRAETPDDFCTAMNRWGAPGENQIYATPDGTIGWQPAGLVPVRPNWDGLVPVPGDGRFEWDGFYDHDELPSSRNPEQGWIATANENNLPADYPNAEKTVGYDWAADSRYRRIAEVLAANSSMSLEDCVRLQMDYVNLAGREIASILGAVPAEGPGSPADARVAEGLLLLQGWDGSEDVDSAAAALFEVWYRRHLRPRLMREFLGRMADAGAGFDVEAALLAVLPKDDKSSDPRADLRLLRSLDPADPGDLAALRAIVEESLAPAVAEVSSLLGDDMSAWAWGRLHHSKLFHPLFAKMSDPKPEWATIGPLPRGGSGDTPGAAGYGKDFNQSSGSSFRIAIDVGEWDNSLAMNSPGQSADPRSEHFADLFPLWAADGAIPLLYTRAAIESHAGSRIRLTPAG